MRREGTPVNISGLLKQWGVLFLMIWAFINPAGAGGAVEAFGYFLNDIADNLPFFS
jgi:hypothetical protein